MKKGLLVVFVFMSVLPSSVISMELFEQGLLTHYSEKNMNRFRAVFFSENSPFPAAHELLKKQNFNINQPVNEHGDRLLHEVSGRTVLWNQQDLERFTFLLEHGAILDLRNDENKTPFDLVKMENYTIFTNWFEKLGYTAFPHSLPPQKNPLHLLGNGASLYKKLYDQSTGTDDVGVATDDAMDATNILADLFMFIKNNENNRLNGQWQWLNYHCEYHPGITVDPKGYFLKHTTFEDLIQHVGKEGIDFVESVLNGMCEKAEQEKNVDVLREIESMYPFVKLYRAESIGKLVSSAEKKDSNQSSVDIHKREQLIRDLYRHVSSKNTQAIKQFVEQCLQIGYSDVFSDFKDYYASEDAGRGMYDLFDCLVYCLEWNNIKYDTTMPQELSVEFVQRAKNSVGAVRCDMERQMIHFLFEELHSDYMVGVIRFMTKYPWLNYKPLYRWMKDFYPQEVTDPRHIFYACVHVLETGEYGYNINNMSTVD